MKIDRLLANLPLLLPCYESVNESLLGTVTFNIWIGNGFPVVLFVMLYKIILTCESVNKTPGVATDNHFLVLEIVLESRYICAKWKIAFLKLFYALFACLKPTFIAIGNKTLIVLRCHIVACGSVLFFPFFFFKHFV